MLRIRCVLLSGLALVVVSQPLEANRFTEFCSRVKRDYHRNNCWPEPFNRPDRLHVQRSLAAATAAGWRRQNLLGDHHFTPDSSTLTTAGELKVRLILTQSPPQYRTVFVQRGPSRDVTAARLDAVEQWTSRQLPAGMVADVQESHLMVEGTPASTVDSINVRFHESQPIPQLPEPKTDYDF